jgi:hypothetical protein
MSSSNRRASVEPLTAALSFIPVPSNVPLAHQVLHQLMAGGEVAPLGQDRHVRDVQQQIGGVPHRGHAHIGPALGLQSSQAGQAGSEAGLRILPVEELGRGGLEVAGKTGGEEQGFHHERGMNVSNDGRMMREEVLQKGSRWLLRGIRSSTGKSSWRLQPSSGKLDLT